MTRTKIVGVAAVPALILGYGGMFAAIALAGFDLIGPKMAVVVAIGLGLVGEVGLWVAAATLGWTVFAKRKAILNRLMGRRAVPTEEAV